MKKLCVVLSVLLSVVSVAQEESAMSRAANARRNAEAAKEAADAAARLAEERQKRLIRERQLEQWKREDEERASQNENPKSAALSGGKTEDQSKPAPVLAMEKATAENIAKMKSSAAEFNAGFKVGYQRAFPQGVCPVPPLAPLGRSTYADGFGVGYAHGLGDEAKAWAK